MRLKGCPPVVRSIREDRLGIGNLREKREGCNLCQVNSFEYFDQTGY